MTLGGNNSTPFPDGYDWAKHSASLSRLSSITEILQPISMINESRNRTATPATMSISSGAISTTSMPWTPLSSPLSSSPNASNKTNTMHSFPGSNASHLSSSSIPIKAFSFGVDWEQHGPAFNTTPMGSTRPASELNLPPTRHQNINSKSIRTTATALMPFLLPRLTYFLSLVEVNIFLQVSKRHLAAMACSDAVQGIAVRHPRDGCTSSYSYQWWKNTSKVTDVEKIEGGGRDMDSHTIATGQWEIHDPTSEIETAHPLLALISRYQKGLRSLRVADLRVFAPTLVAAGQGLLSNLTHLSLAYANIQDKELTDFSILLGRNDGLLHDGNSTQGTSSWSTSSSILSSRCLPSLLPFLEYLTLAGNRFGDPGVMAFADLALGQGALPCLQSLNLGANGFTPSGRALVALARAFGNRRTRYQGGNHTNGTMCVGLKKLVMGTWMWDRLASHARLSSLAIPPASITTAYYQKPHQPRLHEHPLYHLFLSLAPTLEELDLTDVSLLPNEVDALVNACRRVALPAIPSSIPHVPLQTLRFSLSSGNQDNVGETSGNYRPEDGLRGIISAFQDGVFLSVQKLDLFNGNLSGPFLLSLAQALRGDVLPYLQHLRLAHMGLTSQSLSSLLCALRMDTPPRLPSHSSLVGNGNALKVLSLEGNALLGPTGARFLATCVQEGRLGGLQSLNLNGSKCADIGLRELIQAFDGRKTSLPCFLEHLHMDDCDITAQGVACLGGSLRNGRFPGLETLSLALNPGVREEGVRCLVTALEDMGGACKLKTLDLSWTNMTATSAELLAKAFQRGCGHNLSLVKLAQGGPRNIPWSLETRQAFHRVRNVLLARTKRENEREERIAGAGRDRGRADVRELADGDHEAGVREGGKEGGKGSGLGILQTEKENRRQRRMMQHSSSLPRVLCI